MPDYQITLTEKEMELLSAACCVATIASGTPARFDAIPDNEYKGTYAKATLTLLDNPTIWERLVSRLGDMV